MSESGEGPIFVPSQGNPPTPSPTEGSFNTVVANRFTAIADDFAKKDNPDIAVVSITPQASEQSPTEARFQAIASDFAKEDTPDLPNVRIASVEPKQPTPEIFLDTPVTHYLTATQEKIVQKRQLLEQELREITEKNNRKGTFGKISSYLGFNSRKTYIKTRISWLKFNETQYAEALSEINEGNAKKAEEIIDHDADIGTYRVTHTDDHERKSRYEVEAREVIAALRILNPNKARKYELEIA